MLRLFDPFDLKSAPYALIRQCLAGPRDEVLVTLFANELHRFCRRENFDKTMTPYFGADHWQAAVPERPAGARKEAFPMAYQQGLREQGLFTAGFGIRISNQSTHYRWRGDHHASVTGSPRRMVPPAITSPSSGTRNRAASRPLIITGRSAAIGR
ncbi:class I SAM-dependent methyltransferase [Streptomyces acidicola]|uniref:Uncharacterized protein n=1 Tax=Streptomyces acidicola TaxID=2596892 RepID=A0A5N8WR15_9ACTN|nr:hypothetical protein [Streptomyces acidicola]MPY49592.1 hypothetical protein [Streptomyces acidicola]